MNTANGIISDINAVTKRIKVEVPDDGTFLVEVPWYKLNSYLVGMTVKIKYIPDDQFAQFVEEEHVTR